MQSLKKEQKKYFFNLKMKSLQIVINKESVGALGTITTEFSKKLDWDQCQDTCRRLYSLGMLVYSMSSRMIMHICHLSPAGAW